MRNKHLIDSTAIFLPYGSPNFSRENFPAGSHIKEFEGKQLSNGIYLYRIWVGNHFTQTKKLSFSK